MNRKAFIMSSMVKYDMPDMNRIKHAMKVSGFAEAIASCENVEEDKIELLGATLEVEKYICLHGIEILELKVTCRLAYEVVVYAVYLHRCNATRLTRGELIAYRARTREEVENIEFLEIDEVITFLLLTIPMV